jgi:hypothetical protein
MTSVEKARRFIQARGKAIAMTIVPLAAIAVAASQPAKAGGLLFNSGGCIESVTGVFSQPTGKCLDTPIPGFQNGANSIKLSGTATVETVSGGQGSLTIEAAGTANGQAPDVGLLPVSWDFTIQTNRLPVQSGVMGLAFSFNSGSFSKFLPGSLGGFGQCGDDLYCLDIEGSDTVAIDGPVYSWQIAFFLGGTFDPGTILSVNIPGNSIDLNPQSAQVSPAPEPASMALGVSGLLGLAFAKFRRRRKA